MLVHPSYSPSSRGATDSLGHLTRRSPQVSEKRQQKRALIRPVYFRLKNDEGDTSGRSRGRVSEWSSARLSARVDPPMARAAVRPAPFDHAGVIAGFAALSLFTWKALVIEMPFAGYEARG